MTTKRILKPSVLLLTILTLVSMTSGTFLTDWMKGYYHSEGRCLPWDSSCKTCSDGVSWDECEGHMLLSSIKTDEDPESSNGLWESWPHDHYYERVAQKWKPCEDSCIDEWLHRPECFSWPSGKIFDIDEFSWVDTWDPDKLQLESENFTLRKICKNPTIFIDYFSNEVLELGTEKYPYRTMKAATSEILTEYSHSNVSITIYIKDIFLEIDTFYIMNMTTVKIQNHPEYQLMDKRSSLVVTSDVQPDLSKKWRLHLLRAWSSDPSSQIASGEYTEGEISNINLRGNGFVISRTNFEMYDIEIYGTDDTYLFLPLYLQQKQLRLGKLFKYEIFISRFIRKNS